MGHGAVGGDCERKHGTSREGGREWRLSLVVGLWEEAERQEEEARGWAIVEAMGTVV